MRIVAIDFFLPCTSTSQLLSLVMQERIRIKMIRCWWVACFRQFNRPVYCIAQDFCSLFLYDLICITLWSR